MRDDTDVILNELLARPGAPTWVKLRRAALKEMRLSGAVLGIAELDQAFLKRTMIVLAARNDAEADALLERAAGRTRSPRPIDASALSPELTAEGERRAFEALEGFAETVADNRRSEKCLH